MPNRIVTVLATVSMSLVPVMGIAASAEAAPAKARTFKNCTELNKSYAHGVGRPGARDKTSGTPVTNFKRSKALYNANKKSDGDKDGVACEKR